MSSDRAAFSPNLIKVNLERERDRPSIVPLMDTALGAEPGTQHSGWESQTPAASQGMCQSGTGWKVDVEDTPGHLGWSMGVPNCCAVHLSPHL